MCLMVNNVIHSVIDRNRCLAPSAAVCDYKKVPCGVFQRIFGKLGVDSLLNGTMDQISIETPNPNCRLFLKIDQ